MSRAALALAGGGLFVSASLAQCPGSEAPADFCSGARVLSGNPGTQVLYVNAGAATGSGEDICGVPVGHTTWFRMVPAADGILTFSTCHPLTTFDTVADAWVGGESSCEFMSFVQCNDDTQRGDCLNGCSAYGSTLRFSVSAGQLYRFRVGSYNNNSAGCTLCLGVVVTLCTGDSTPPETSISSPAPLACVCPGEAAITGSVMDPASGVSSWTIDFAPVAGAPWLEIARGLGNVTGNLATWNTSSLAEGDYYLRLTARDGCDNVSTTITTCHVNAAFDSLVLRSPTSGAVLGGTVVADGTAWDHCAPGSMTLEWAPTGGMYSAFDTLSPPWVINDPLGAWNTRARTDGNYSVRLTGRTPCGSRTQRTADIVVDNTPPIALITQPTTCTRVAPGMIQVRGTAADVHLASWVLQYTGGDSPGWSTIAGGTSPVFNGVLGTWDTRLLRQCAYTIRLVVTDAAIIDSNGALHNQSEYKVSLNIGTDCNQDYNGDGVVNSQDFFDFLVVFFNGCP